MTHAWLKYTSAVLWLWASEQKNVCNFRGKTYFSSHVSLWCGPLPALYKSRVLISSSGSCRCYFWVAVQHVLHVTVKRRHLPSSLQWSKHLELVSQEVEPTAWKEGTFLSRQNRWRLTNVFENCWLRQICFIIFVFPRFSRHFKNRKVHLQK